MKVDVNKILYDLMYHAGICDLKNKNQLNDIKRDLNHIKPFINDRRIFQTLKLISEKHNGKAQYVSNNDLQRLTSAVLDASKFVYGSRDNYEEVYNDFGELNLVYYQNQILFWGNRILVDMKNNNLNLANNDTKYLFACTREPSSIKQLRKVMSKSYNLVQLNVGRIVNINDVGTMDGTAKTIFKSDPKLIKSALLAYFKYMGKLNRELEVHNKSILLRARKILSTVNRDSSAVTSFNRSVDGQPVNDKYRDEQARSNDINKIKKIFRIVKSDYDGMNDFCSQYNDSNVICYEPPLWAIRRLCGLLEHDLYTNKYPHEIKLEIFELGQHLIFGRRYKNKYDRWLFYKNQPLGKDDRYAPA